MQLYRLSAASSAKTHELLADIRFATISARMSASWFYMKMMRSIQLSVATVLAPVAFMLSGVLAPAGFAQVSSVGADPTIIRLQSRLDAVEMNLQRSTGRLEESGFQTSQLRKTIESQAREIATLKKSLAAQNSRLAKLEALLNAPAEEAANAASGPAEQTVSLVGPTQPATKEALAAQRINADGLSSKTAPALELKNQPEGLFKQAKSLLLKGDYPAAEAAFKRYITDFPDTPQTGEAQYWLGESLLIQEAFPEAAEAYVTLIAEWPEAARTPDGFVKLARSLRMLNETDQACAALNELTSRYPDLSPVTRSLAASERARSKCDANR